MGTVTDADEFAGTFARHQPALLKLAVTLGAGGAAEDVVQETMLRAWKRRSDFPGGPPRAWLMQVTRNLVTDHHRSRERHERPRQEPVVRDVLGERRHVRELGRRGREEHEVRREPADQEAMSARRTYPPGPPP